MYATDHYHYVRDIQGAAPDGHTHTARDVGAAEENDVTGLQQRVGLLEADNSALGKRVQDLERQLVRAHEANQETSAVLLEHMKNFHVLGEQVARIAGHIVALQGGN